MTKPLKLHAFMHAPKRTSEISRSLLLLALLLAPVQAKAAETNLSDMELLGKLLFEDPALSQPNGTSCASCHVKALGYSGNNNSSIPAVARGSRPGQFGTRKVPSLMYIAFTPPLYFSEEENDKGEKKMTAKGGLFWDGRADGFLDQIRGPLFSSNEMNNADEKQLVASVKDSRSAQAMKKVFGEAVFENTDTAMNGIATALAAYENSETFRPFSSKFDRFLSGQEKLTAQEARGFALFKDKEKGNCISCHAGKDDSTDPQDWLFTDFTFDNVGLPRNKTIPANHNESNFDLGLCKRPGLEAKLPEGVETQDLCGAFKVPSLRNVALRKSFFHNGAFTKLRDAVAFYATRDTNPARWYPLSHGKVQKLNDLPEEYRKNVNTDEVPYDRKPGEKPRLTETEIDDITAFLRTLTDTSLAKN